jgi:hypothetical protein
MYRFGKDLMKYACISRRKIAFRRKNMVFLSRSGKNTLSSLVFSQTWKLRYFLACSDNDK